MGAVETDAGIRTVETEITYLAPGDFINRRFVAPGVEHNTGRYQTYPVKVRDGRPIKDQFNLDAHGFVLAKNKSKVKDFFDNDEVSAIYPGEVDEAVKALTGASCVTLLGWMVRTSGDLSKYERKTVGYTHQGGVQPPAGEAHVDFTPDRAERMARALYERDFPNGKGYSRFIASSLWRTFSEPPQDWPLAVCDARSIGRNEGTPNTMFVVDEIPDEATMLGPMPNEDTVPAAAIFHFNPNHRWWYFSNMTRDEVLLVKFHDSDPTKALRCAHTAFRDPTFPNAKERQSIEFRTVAFFD